jgi:hypothetical protein
MTKTFAQAAAVTFAAVLTVATFAGANAMATQAYVKADAVATAQAAPAPALQMVVAVGHRA